MKGKSGAEVLGQLGRPGQLGPGGRPVSAWPMAGSPLWPVPEWERDNVAFFVSPLRHTLSLLFSSSLLSGRLPFTSQELS